MKIGTVLVSAKILNMTDLVCLSHEQRFYVFEVSHDTIQSSFTVFSIRVSKIYQIFICCAALIAKFRLNNLIEELFAVYKIMK